MPRTKKARKDKIIQGWASLFLSEFRRIREISKQEKRKFAAVCGDMVRLGLAQYAEWRAANPLPARPPALLVEGGTELRSTLPQ